MKNWIFLTMTILLLSCSEEEKAPFDPLKIQGLKNFGDIALGDAAESVVIADNRDNNSNAKIEFDLAPDYIVTQVNIPECNLQSVPSGHFCKYKIRYMPLSLGSSRSTILFRGKSVAFEGRGVMPGELSLLIRSVDLGEIIAGSIHSITLPVRNNGDTPISLPDFTLSEYITVADTSCIQVIPPRSECELYINVSPKIKTDIFNEFLISDLNPSVRFDVFAKILAAESSGEISLTRDPELSLIPVTKECTTNCPEPYVITISNLPIKDRFGNIVEDGTPVDVATYNLNIIGDFEDPTKIRLFTMNGTVSVKIEPGKNTGHADIVFKTETSQGSLTFTIVN